MRNGSEILKHVNPIRWAAHAVGRSPSIGSNIVEACLWVERAGVPTSYRLPATAREYSAFQSNEQMIVTLAARVGNPRVSPVPPLWPILALLLLGCRGSLLAHQILERATELEGEDHVHRGLAIIVYLFPELEDWLNSVPLRIPLWERTLAVPLAARKLVLLENVKQPGPGGLTVARPSRSMTETVGPVRWHVTGGSRRGTSHVRVGLKNQDAIQYSMSRDGATVVLAVADGHGSDLCFRSDTGSRLAAEIAIELLGRFASTVSGGESSSAVSYHAQAVLAEELTQSWRAAVDRDLQAQPFTPADWGSLVARQGWQGRQIVERHPELAYGSTILGVLATQTYVLSLQLGDGDILLVDTQGRTCRAMPPYDGPTAKQTPSLWRRNASAEVRVHIQHALDDLPVLVLAATDGYADCCASNDEFLEIGADYLKIMRVGGFNAVEKRLQSFLDEASSAGSGDDITIGVISRFDSQDVPILDAMEPETVGR